MTTRTVEPTTQEASPAADFDQCRRGEFSIWYTRSYEANWTLPPECQGPPPGSRPLLAKGLSRSPGGHLGALQSRCGPGGPGDFTRSGRRAESGSLPHQGGWLLSPPRIRTEQYLADREPKAPYLWGCRATPQRPGSWSASTCPGPFPQPSSDDSMTLRRRRGDQPNRSPAQMISESPCRRRWQHGWCRWLLPSHSPASNGAGRSA